MDSTAAASTLSTIGAAQEPDQPAANAVTPARQKDAARMLAAPKQEPAKEQARKEILSPQHNHVKAGGRRAAQSSPAGSAGARADWIPVPGQPDRLEQKAEWQAAGGRKAKRTTSGKPDEGVTSQQAPEAAPARPAKLQKPQKPAKGAVAETRSSMPEKTDGAGKGVAAPGRANCREERARPQPSGQAPAGAKGVKANTGKAARAAPPEGKRLSPSKAAREPPVAAEQPGRRRKHEESQPAHGAPPISFAEMARPARSSQPVPSSQPTAPIQPAPPAAAAPPVAVQKSRPVQASAPVMRPVQNSHHQVVKPPAATAAPGPGPVFTMEAKSVPMPAPSRRDTAAPGPWPAAAGPPAQDSQARPQSSQPAVSTAQGSAPSGAPCPPRSPILYNDIWPAPTTRA